MPRTNWLYGPDSKVPQAPGRKALALGRFQLEPDWPPPEAPDDLASEKMFARPALVSMQPEVLLEQFVGFVEQIDGAWAVVKLTSEHGDVLYGRYPADALASKGIQERRRFKCDTVESRGRVHVRLAPIPDVELSAETEKKLSNMIDRLIGDGD